MSASCSPPLVSNSPRFITSPPNSRAVFIRCLKLKFAQQSIPSNGISTFHGYSVHRSFPKHRWRWRFCCFQDGGSPPEFLEQEPRENNISEEFVDREVKHQIDTNAISYLKKIRYAVFNAEPWQVPWTARTVTQVMLLWIASFWLIGSWIIPFLAHATGFSKESLTCRGQALYSLLTDVTEGLAGIAILHRCLAKYQPLSSDWFRFSLAGKWQIDVGLGCLMFPLINHLSQVNFNLAPSAPSLPIKVSNVQQSIFARDPVEIALYLVVVSVCAPIWEEIVFRGFLLPSLTRYMPVWCSILVSSVAFALAHCSLQRILPLIFLGVLMGTVFVRSRNMFASSLLHSLWNAFVFLDIMK